jgi:hypothetical protein
MILSTCFAPWLQQSAYACTTHFPAICVLQDALVRHAGAAAMQWDGLNTCLSRFAASRSKFVITQQTNMQQMIWEAGQAYARQNNSELQGARNARIMP